MAKSKLEEALEKYLNGNLELRAGILDGATYDDGTPVAHVAYIHEFGASINQAERTGTIYRSIRKDGAFNKNGRFVKARNANFATEHSIPAHTINIPPRPFFRSVIANGKTTWSAILSNGIKNRGSIKGGMEYLGGAIVEELHASVMTWTSPPNAASTIAKKGSNSPLRDSMRLSRSFSYEVNDDQG
ncbi:hypothetical protein ACIH2S_07420 [Providencia sp. PAZ2]|uniref:hypothetical protein n=1 Tax=Providencia lanzhouensis TaxID=3378099 RepID=UPI003D2DE2CF